MKDSHLIPEQEEEKNADESKDSDDEMETDQNEQALPPGATSTKDSKIVYETSSNHIWPRRWGAKV